jgi:hypothetical protein
MLLLLLLLLWQHAATAPPPEPAVPSWNNFRPAVNQQVGNSTVGRQAYPFIKLGTKILSHFNPFMAPLGYFSPGAARKPTYKLIFMVCSTWNPLDGKLGGLQSHVDEDNNFWLCQESNPVHQACG